MKPRLFPLILILSMGILTGLIIHQRIREHLRPPVMDQGSIEPESARDLANEALYDETARPAREEE